MSFSRRHFLACTSAAMVLPAQGKALINPSAFNDDAERIVERTLDRLEQNRHNASSQPLMLLIGETHTELAHMIVQLLVLEKLRHEGVNFCVGLEFSHDHIFKAYSMAMNGDWRNWDRSKVNAIKHFDPDGTYALQSLILHQASIAEYAHQVVWHYLLENSIPSHVNDAAWARIDDSTRIDLRDPLTLDYIARLFNEDIMTMPMTTPEALLLRNHIMSDQAIDFAKEKNADLHVQLCGSGHITGTARPPRVFSDSLCALYRQKAVPFLAAPLIMAEEQNNVAADMVFRAEDIVQDLIYPREQFQDGQAAMNTYLHNNSLGHYQMDVERTRRNIETQFSSLFPQWKQELEFAANIPANDL